MLKLSIACVAVLSATSVCAESGGVAHDLREPHLVLYGAWWCAPCVAEYRDLPALVLAVRPARIVLAWMDRPAPVPAGLSDHVESLPVGRAKLSASKHLGEGFGLPSAALVGASGALCHVWRERVRVAEVARLVRSCRLWDR